MLLGMALLFAGLFGGAFLHHRFSPRIAPESGRATDGNHLSDGTRRVIESLDTPVSIRFYSILDKSAVSPALFDFSAGVGRLLRHYQDESGGRIKLTMHVSRTDAAEAAAVKDGVKPFNLDKGDACYLGVVIEQKDRKEFVPLSADWEAAVESDVSRAIARLRQPPASGTPVAAVAQPNQAAIEELKRAIPNLAAVSVDEGTRLLREQGLATFAAAAQEMDAQIKQAEQRFLEAEQSGVPAAVEAARKELQRVRAEQSDKLRAIGVRIQEQINTLEQLKN